MRRRGRPTQVERPYAGRPRVTRTQRNSSTIFTGVLAGRSSAAGSSDGSTRKRSASPMSVPRTAARNVAYSSASTRPQPNARRIGSSHGGTARGRIANSAFAAAVSPNETETFPPRLARNAAGERARRGVRSPQRRELPVVQVRQRHRLARQAKAEPPPPRRQRLRRTPGVVAAEMAASPGAEEAQECLAVRALRKVERRTGRVVQEGEARLRPGDRRERPQRCGHLIARERRPQIVQ